jgi:hypothetical protein
MKPKITVVLGSCRPGGLDVTFPALAQQTHDNFEVLFVDGRYRKRHPQVMAAAKTTGLQAKCDSMGSRRFMHVPNHRNQPEGSLWTTPGAGYNTGIMLAGAPIVLFMMDYACPGPGWVAAHAKAHEESGRFVMGPYRYFEPPVEVCYASGERPRTFRAGDVTGEDVVRQRSLFDESSVFGSTRVAFCVGEPMDSHRQFKTGPLDVTWCHTKNESFPREAALSINGFPEWYDRICGPGDTDFAYQLGQRAGLRGWLQDDARLDAIDMRWILTNGSIVVPRSSFSTDPMAIGRPYYDLGDRFYQRRRGLRFPVNNHFDIRSKMLEIWDWRDWGALDETIIRDTSVADEDYFPGWHTAVVESVARGDEVAV